MEPGRGTGSLDTLTNVIPRASAGSTDGINRMLSAIPLGRMAVCSDPVSDRRAPQVHLRWSRQDFQCLPEQAQRLKACFFEQRGTGEPLCSPRMVRDFSAVSQVSSGKADARSTLDDTYSPATGSGET